MKSFIKEFKEFAMRGNVMDMAVGIIIGGAFTAIVTSMVDDILSPFIGLFFRADVSTLTFTLAGVPIAYGKFIMAVINFLLVALVLFMIIKATNKAAGIARKPKEPAEEEPTTKICPYCKSEIAIDATRCPNCTSQLED